MRTDEPGGGAEAIARQWITELRSQGHAVTIYAYGREQPRVALPIGTASHTLTSRGGLIRPALMPIWLRARVRRDHPDVVLSLMTFSNVVALLALKFASHTTTPVLVSEHNVPTAQAVNIRRRDRVTDWLARRLYRRATGALAVSHPVAAELVAGFGVPPGRIFVVPNPVVAQPAKAEEAAYDAPADLHLLLVGRLVAQKRPHLFLDVIHELAERGVRVRATVIGEGPLRSSTELQSHQRGLDVSFLGWREPWWTSVSEVDCLVLTANAEGLANVLIEAAAAGIPSVASSRALGVADAIVPGITGELVLGDSPAAYSDAVLRAIRLTLTGQMDLSDWLDRFSSSRSTNILLEALYAISDWPQAPVDGGVRSRA
jgi:glycosyltransferase involved in cell wall biosynthesis